MKTNQGSPFPEVLELKDGRMLPQPALPLRQSSGHASRASGNALADCNTSIFKGTSHAACQRHPERMKIMVHRLTKSGRGYSGAESLQGNLTWTTWKHPELFAKSTLSNFFAMEVVPQPGVLL